MAPIVSKPTHTMSTTVPNPVRKANSSEYTSIVVGHGSSSVTVQTLVAPSIHAFIPDKAMAFDFLFSQLRPFHPAINVVDLTTALSNHFDVNHSVARSETAAVLTHLHAALFQCSNLTGLRFLDQDGNPVGTVVEDPADRPDGIAFFVFDTTVTASTIDHRLSAVDPFTIRFALPLPQTERPVAAAAVPAAGRPGSNAIETPRPSASFEARLEAAIAGSVALEGDDASVDSSARLLALQVELRSLMRQAPSPRRLFQSGGNYGTLGTSLSPQMARLLAAGTNPGSLPTFLGSLHFLEDQNIFDSVFPAPQPLEEDGVPCDRASSASVGNRIKEFLGRCELELFADILRLDYVGSDAVTGPETVRQISDRLSRLSIVYQARGQTHTCRVDDLFKKYLSEVPVLPDDTRLWGFTLTNYFWSALPEEMQSRITDNKLYEPPDMSTLVTKTIQLNELRKLREAAVQAAKELSEHDTKLARMISESLRKHQPLHRSASPGPTATVHAAMTSSAESVMAQYRDQPPPLATFPPPSLPPAPGQHYGPASVARGDAPSGPMVDPYTGYVSPYARDFRGCLGCGAEVHQYKDCPLNRSEPTHSTFTKNFLARYPDKRKYPPRPEEVTTLVTASFPAAPPPPPATPVTPGILRNPSSGGVGRGAGAVLPAWMTRGGEGPAPAAEGGSSKKVRLYSMFVRILQHSASDLTRVKPFPIRINNLMPAITFDLGTPPAPSVSLVCLYDTCAAVCSGNLLFHQWVITTYPELVHSFEQFDDSNPFEAIKLVGALKDPAEFDVAAHGQLTAVVRYHLPYLTVPDESTAVLCLALGADVSVNTILGWPAIEDLGIDLRLKSEVFFSTTFNRSFPLGRVAAPCGIPDGVVFDPARDFRRPGSSSAASAKPVLSLPNVIVSLPSASEFNTRLQMQVAAAELNAVQFAMRQGSASSPSVMHALASGTAELGPVSPDCDVLEGPTYDASPNGRSS